jgi:hypothetical protein
MSKQNLSVAVVVAIVGSILGCGGPQKPQDKIRSEMDGAPAWVKVSCRKGLPGGKGICGAGSVPNMTSISLARSAAEGRARTALARSLQIRVKAMLKDYQAGTTGGAENYTLGEAHIEDVARQITDRTLSGTQVEDTWLSDNGTLWALVIMDAESFKDSLRNMRQLSEGLRDAVIQRADKAFDELDAAPSP